MSKLCYPQVVDLWGSTNNPNFTGDTLSNVFSSTKSITSIVLASLVDQGLMQYDDKISQHWPQFAQNGKEEITVADLMRHEAGLAELDTPITLPSLLTENIKKNEVGASLEQEKPRYPEEGKREYHAITRGWVANEIFRRVDTRGRTMAEYLSEAIAGPLGADVYVGPKGDKFNDYNPVKEIPFAKVVKESFKKDGAVYFSFFELMSLLNQFRKLTKGVSKPAIAPYEGLSLEMLGPFFNADIVRQGESFSANGNCSARGLATLGAAMANKGTFNNVQIMSNKAWEEMHKFPKYAPIYSILPTNFTQGGVNKFGDYEEGREGYYGWFGYGGSVFQWNPDLRIGFAYVPSYLHALDMTNARGKKLQEEVAKIAKRLNN